MGQDSKIEWCHHSFNHVRGCTKVSAGCANCYAETLSKRNPSTLGIWGDNGIRVVASESMWKQPLKWNAEAKAAGFSRRVFCASLADVFEDWQGPMLSSGTNPCYLGMDYRASNGTNRLTMNHVRFRLYRLITDTPHLDWLLLTKRPENLHQMWHVPNAVNTYFPFENAWLGVSVEDQANADKRIPLLLRAPAKVRFLSCEPLLGPVDISKWLLSDYDRYCIDDRYGIPKSANRSKIDWVIAGGESGSNARPMHPDWARSLRNQCTAAGVPFHFKQWGEWSPNWSWAKAENVDPITGKHKYPGNNLGPKGLPIQGDNTMFRVGKKAAGRLLDGREWNEFPNV